MKKKIIIGLVVLLLLVAAGVYLAERDGISLQELLEKDAILAVLARGDADR